MTRVIAQDNDLWALRKIQALVGLETGILKKQIGDVQKKIRGFEDRYGKFDSEKMYGQVDDMELIEWEGEIETLERLRSKLTRLEDVGFGYE